MSRSETKSHIIRSRTCMIRGRLSENTNLYTSQAKSKHDQKNIALPEVYNEPVQGQNEIMKVIEKTLQEALYRDK